MNEFLNKISIKVNKNVFIKDPESSALGKKIIQGSIELIDNVGFDDFNFKKLAKKIVSTEASIYRYFENKHNLLVYLVLWYWGWQEYRLIMRTLNISDPKEKLKRAIAVITEVIQEDSDFSTINEVKLNSIVNAEASKIYLSKKVDQDNESGFFFQYKEVVERLANIIEELNPSYKYPHMLVSTLIEGAQQQRYFAEHLPRLTDHIKGEDAVTRFYTDLIFKSIID